MKGEGADAIRAYIREYHLSMINGLTVLLLQLYSKLLLYTDDYYTNIDADPDAMLIEDALNSYIDSIRNRMNKVDYFHEEARTALKSVSSMCNMDVPGKVAFEEIGRGLVRRMEQLINDVTVLGENHVGDLDEPEEMLRSLNGMMSLFNWRPGKRMSGYSAGLVTGSTEFVVYAYAIQENMEDYEAQVEQIEIAQEHEEDRKIVEQRILGGVLQVLNGLNCIITGVLAILSTGGAATPLVVLAWFGAGGATLYGLSEIGEGIQSHALGLQRDTETETFNFERDVLCGGNQELYDTLGKISVELCDLADFGVDMTDLFGTLRRKGFGGRFGVNQLDDYAEHLTKGMDEVDDVLDDVIEAIPTRSMDDVLDDVVEAIPTGRMDDVVDDVVEAIPSGSADDIVEGISGSITTVKPSNSYNPDARPSGTVTRITDNMDDATKRSLTRENEAAETLAKNGYDVEQNPTINGTTRNPDYVIEGEVFDCYSPAESTSVRNIASTIEEKVISKGQANNIVLNLDDWKGDVDALIKQLNDYPIDGLNEVLVVQKGEVISIYP